MADQFPIPVSGGDVPELDSLPNLTASSVEGELSNADLTLPHADRAWKDNAESPTRIVERVCNRYRLDRIGEETWWEARFVDPPVVKQERLPDGSCQTFQKSIAEEFTGVKLLVLVWVETYVVDEGLEEYYSWTAGAPAAVGEGAAIATGFAGAKVTAAGVAMAESAAVAEAALIGTGVAAGGLALEGVAVFAGAFFTTSAIMANIALPAETKSSEGWRLVGRYHEAKRRTATAPRESWVAVGNPHPCDPDVLIEEPPEAVSLTPPETVVREREERMHPPQQPKSPLEILKRFWWILIAVAVVVVALIAMGGNGSDPIDTEDIIIGLPSSTSPTTGPPTTPVPSTAPSPTTLPPTEPTRTLGEILFGSDGRDETIALARERDAIGDFVYSQNGVTPGNTGPDVDLERWAFGRLFMDPQGVDRHFNNSTYECGQSDPIVVCSDEVQTFPAGDVVVVVEVLAGPVASESWQYTYAAVFESDGDPSNDFVASETYDWDYFQGTDQWYVLDFVDDWSLGRWDGDFFEPQTPTAARVVIDGELLLWFIPMSEFDAEPTGRLTAFRHDGSFAPEVSGGDVTGANPTEPLATIEPLSAG